jgi:hypothetical protein
MKPQPRPVDYRKTRPGETVVVAAASGAWVITALLESFRLTRYVWHLSATKQTNKPFRVGTP